MTNTFFKSFVVILGLTLSAQAQTPAERQQQELSPEIKKIIAESSPLNRWVTPEQLREIINEVAAQKETERTMVVDTRDQEGCHKLFNQFRSEGWQADKKMCEPDSTKPLRVIKVRVKISDCIIKTSPAMKISDNKCPYLTIKINW